MVLEASERVRSRLPAYDLTQQETLFELNYEPSRLLDEIFRNLGWIAEQPILLNSYKEKPLMYDSEYQTEYDSLMNCILSAGDRYANKRPNWYPLIYFGTIESIVETSVRLLKLNNNINIRNSIFNPLYTIFRYFEKALEANNVKGVAYAFTKLDQLYEYLNKEGIEESAGQAVELIVEMGVLVSDRKDINNFSGSSLFKEILELLAKSIHDDKIRHALHEANIKFSLWYKGDSVWQFITELGGLRQNNFGFMFDWRTGRLYADDDPRRH
jgi:hypothetical protein